MAAIAIGRPTIRVLRLPCPICELLDVEVLVDVEIEVHGPPITDARAWLEAQPLEDWTTIHRSHELDVPTIVDRSRTRRLTP